MVLASSLLECLGCGLSTLSALLYLDKAAEAVTFCNNRCLIELNCQPVNVLFYVCSKWTELCVCVHACVCVRVCLCMRACECDKKILCIRKSCCAMLFQYRILTDVCCVAELKSRRVQCV